MVLLTMTFKIVMICSFGIINGFLRFDRQCPHSSQRKFRIWSECNSNSTIYNCLYNTNNKAYTELCANNEKARKGLKYVISGTFRNVRCSKERYQPFTFWSNRSADCLYLKSPCSDTGQIVFDDMSTIADSSCRCDYTSNYAFVSKTRNPCFCTPSVEDCTCYIKRCPFNTTLSPDYECVSRDSTNTSFKCQSVIYTQTTVCDTTILYKGNEQGEPSTRLVRTITITFILAVIAGILLYSYHFVYRCICSKGRNKQMCDAKNERIHDGKHIDIKKGHLDQPNSQSNKMLDPNIDKQDLNGRTPLIEACVQISIDDVRNLIRGGAKINITDNEGNTPLYWSCFGGNITLVNMIIGAGSDIQTSNRDGITPLMIACGNDHLSVVKLLIENGADVKIADKDGKTPLSWSCCAGHKDIARLSICKDFKEDTPCNYGFTLMSLYGNTRLPIAKLLIEKGADVNVSDKEGQTPFYLSCGGGYIDIVNLLVDKTYDIHKATNVGYTPFMVACIKGHRSIVKLLIENGAEINSTDKEGNTQFSLGCFRGDIDIVNLLLEEGCAIDKPNNYGITPLMKSCCAGHLYIVKLLIENGAAIAMIDHKGHTPFYWSCVGGHFDILSLLIYFDCDKNTNGFV